MQHKAAQGTKWQDLINKALTGLQALGLRPQSACLEEMQEREVRMLSTDTNTISTTVPSPSLSQPSSQRHPHTTPSRARPAQVRLLTGKARQRCLCKQPVHRRSTHFAGKQHSSLPLLSPQHPLSTEHCSCLVVTWSHPGSCSRSPEHSCSLQSPIMVHSLPQTFS